MGSGVAHPCSVSWDVVVCRRIAARIRRRDLDRQGWSLQQCKGLPFRCLTASYPQMIEPRCKEPVKCAEYAADLTEDLSLKSASLGSLESGDHSNLCLHKCPKTVKAISLKKVLPTFSFHSSLSPLPGWIRGICPIAILPWPQTELIQVNLVENV